jgi:hypothetical protein
MSFINILLKPIKRQLVSIFKFAIILSFFLNRIVGQVNCIVLAVVQNVLKCSCTTIAFFAKEDFHVLVYQNPNSNIELPAVYQIRPLYVLLYYETHVFVYLERCRKLI